MNTVDSQARDTVHEEEAAQTRSERVATVAWLTGVTGVMALISIGADASVGAGLAVASVCCMVVFVSYLIWKS